LVRLRRQQWYTRIQWWILQKWPFRSDAIAGLHYFFILVESSVFVLRLTFTFLWPEVPHFRSGFSIWILLLYLNSYLLIHWAASLCAQCSLFALIEKGES
jgi:hypothetical protein